MLIACAVSSLQKHRLVWQRWVERGLCLENRKPESGGELRSISKAELYSWFLKAGFKSRLFFWFSIILFPTLQHSEGCVLYTWLHLEFSLAGIVTTTGLFSFEYHIQMHFTPCLLGMQFGWGENWEGRLAQGKVFGARWVFVVRWGFSVGVMRWGNCWVALSPFFCLLCAWLANLPPLAWRLCTIHAGIGLVALSF